MFKATPLHPTFAAEASGIDLRQPTTPDLFRQITEALDRYAVLIFRGQALSDIEQVTFSEMFGPVGRTRQADRPGHKLRLHAQLSDISNLDENNALLAADDRRRMDGLGNRLWHTDRSFHRVPAKYSLLSAHVVPAEGGETEFADLRAAYDALPPKKQAMIENLIAEHSIYASRAVIGFTDFSAEERAALPPVPQTLVRRHPGSKRRTLYLAAHIESIRGMPLHDLIEHATQRQFVHSHQWQVGDLVIWDNRCTMHRAREYDMAEPRDMRRTTVSDSASTLEQPR
ncbi:MAG: TauD/TfdA dioxygenase family protein [Alphaproteobacteria bacterium]